MNTLVVVGFGGTRRAFLNVSVEKAEARARIALRLDASTQVETKTFAFHDEFGVSLAWQVEETAVVAEEKKKKVDKKR